MSNTLRPIAIHLPQFHPTPENDAWWGKGVTEWTNVTKAKPLFEGHYQPHLPADLGFYDLRLEESRLAQEALAKEYGIYGFCYYHYWFNGKRILQEPVDRKLNNPNEDLPFMICWANENWTRRWDGGDESILMEQVYSYEDDVAHIKSLIPYLKDSRYIRVDNKAVLAIYKDYLIPDIRQTLNIWRTEASKEGVELYLLKFENKENYQSDYKEAGFDAAVEFQPWAYIFDQFVSNFVKKKITDNWRYRFRYHYFRLTRNQEALAQLKYFRNYQLSYTDYVDYILSNYTYMQDGLRYPCIMPSWDNTARIGKRAFYFTEANPEDFKRWARFHFQNFKPPTPEENFIFINAWNEWAEGNHLEPCQRWGRAYLEALRF